MDFKRMFTAMVLSMLILIGWEQLFPSPKSQPQTATQSTTTATQATPLTATSPITVETDTVKAVIDEKSGDLRSMILRHYDATNDTNQQFTLFSDGKPLTYIAQSELIDAAGSNVLANATFSAAQKSYIMNGDKLEVRLSAQTTNGLQVDKVYTFTKGSYLVNVRFDVKNSGSQAVQLGTAYKSFVITAHPMAKAGLCTATQVLWFIRPIAINLKKFRFLI